MLIMKGKGKKQKTISAEKASSIFIQPYVTEKTFNVIEKENYKKRNSRGHENSL
jgi:hypothetical protein